MILKSALKLVGWFLVAGYLLQTGILVRHAAAIPITIEPVFGELTLRQLLEQGQFARARDIAEAQLRESPDNGEMLAVLGYAQAALGDLEGARQSVLRAIELTPSGNADDQRVLLAEIYAGLGDNAEAERVLLDVTGRAPRNVRALIGLGLLYTRTGNIPGATTSLNRALQVDPESGGALTALFQIHMAQNDYAAVRRASRNVPANSPSKAIGLYFEAVTQIRQSEPDFAAAVTLLENALQLAGPTPEVLTTLGYSHLKNGQTAAGVSRLSAAVDLAPDSYAAQKLLGTALLQLNQPRYAVNHLQKALDIEASPELRYTLARAHLASGDSQAGLRELTKALEGTDQSAGQQASIAGLTLFTGGEFEQSEEALRKAMSESPDADHLHALLIATLLKRQRYEGAAREARQALAAFPEQRVLLLNMLALAEMGSGGFADAESHLLEALELDPGARTTRNNLSTLYFRQRQYSKAEAQLKVILASDPDSIETKGRLARIYQAAGRFADADRALLDEDGQPPASGALLRELVLQKIRQRDYTAALEYASHMVARFPRSYPGYLLQAQALAGLGRETDAVYALETGFAETGETQGALASAASLARVNGWHSTAIRYLRRHNAAFGMDDPKIAKLYVVELIEVGDTSEAREVIETGLNAGDPDALFLLAKSYIVDGDQVRAEEYIDAALDAGVSPDAVEKQRAALRIAMQAEDLRADLDADPSNAERYRALAETHELVGNYDAAIGVYAEGIGKAGNDRAFETQIARLHLKKGDTQRAIEVASSAVRGTNLDEDTAQRAYAVLGMSWAQQRDTAKAEKALTRATVDGSRLAPAFYELARIKSAGDDIPESIRLLRSAIEIQPGDLRYYLALAALYQRSDDVGEMIAVYEQGIASNPGAVALLNNVALIYLDQGATGSALARATTALEISPENPRVLNTLGRIYLKDKAADQAIRYFERAVDRNPSSSLYRYHLGAAYFESGSRDLAAVELRESLARQSDAPWAADVRRMLQEIGDA
jgi:tetratricopeptide (TPR) repeat protein